MQVTIAGSGGWGTALAILLHENGHDVTLWSHFETESKQLAETHQNPYLPGVTLPEGLHYSADPACAQGREMVVFATPSFAVRTTARAFAPYLAETPLLVSVTKGIEEGTGYRMSELVSQETGRTVVALSGIMLCCYALFAALRQDILLGAALGTAAALVNFAAMILGLLRASKKENPLSAQLTSRVLFVVRMVVLLVVLVIALKSKRFDPLATLLPLCFMRLALMASELVRKKKKGVPAA